MKLPDCGLIALEDAETGHEVLIDSSDEALRKHYAQNNIDRLAAREKLFRSVGVDFINISTDAPYTDSLVKFFIKRRRRKR
jgi:hypothetical protein